MQTYDSDTLTDRSYSESHKVYLISHQFNFMRINADADEEAEGENKSKDTPDSVKSTVESVLGDTEGKVRSHPYSVGVLLDASIVFCVIDSEIAASFVVGACRRAISYRE